MTIPFNPTREACRDVQDHMFIARLFRSAPDMLDALFGPPDHNAHVVEYRREQMFAEQAAMLTRANAAVDAEVHRIIAGWRA